MYIIKRHAPKQCTVKIIGDTIPHSGDEVTGFTDLYYTVCREDMPNFEHTDEDGYVMKFSEVRNAADLCARLNERNFPEVMKPRKD